MRKLTKQKKTSLKYFHDFQIRREYCNVCVNNEEMHSFLVILTFYSFLHLLSVLNSIFNCLHAVGVNG